MSSGASTDDTTPTLRGSGPASSVITLRYKMDGGSYASTTVSVDNAGNWSWTPSALVKGSWTFEVQKAGQSDWSSFRLTIDPDLDRYPTIDSALDNAGPVTGSLSSGASTDDTTPTLRGTGPANSVITLRYKLGNGGYTLDSASVDADGNWSWTPNTLAKGSWTFEVQKDGQSGWSSFKLTIDPALDLKPTIDSAWDDFGAVTGSLTSGDTTDDNTPTLRGTGVAGTIIHFQNGLAGSSWVNVGSTVVKADGTWEWTSPVLSKNGTWEFHAKAQNGDVISDWTGKFILKYVAAAGPVITDALDNVGPVTGSLSSGASTDDSTPTLRGTGPANSTITLRYKLGSGSYASTTVSVDNAGNWSWTPDTLAKGSWTFEVQNAGQSGWSSFQLTIDPDLDRYPTIDSALDNVGPVTGSLSSGATTDDSTPTLRGSGPANSVITLRYKLGSGNYASTTVSVDGNGKWTWTPSALANGSWTFEVQKAGQSGWSSFTLTIDPTVDRDAVINSAWDDFGAVTGTIANGGTTDDSTPTLRGTGPANSSIALKYSNGDRSGGIMVKVDASGNWTWTAPDLEDGHWTFEVKKDGQESASRYELTIDSNADRNASIDSAFDNVGPVTGSLSSGSSTDDTTPTLRGSGPSNGTITLRYKLGTGSYASTTVSVDNTGNWSWTPSGLAKGSWTFEVQKAGQNGWSSFQLTIDPDLDRYPTIDSALDNVGPVTGSLSSGATTDDTTPTLRGTGPANSVITLRYKLGNGGYTIDSASVDASGNWSWTPNTLAKGSWTFEVQKDGQSGWSSFQLTIDPNLDRNATIDSAFDNVGPVTGSLSSGSSTDDTTPTLRGSGPASGTITLRYKMDGGSYASTTVSVDVNGTWSWTPNTLAKGSWTFEVQKSGQSGWSSFQLTIDPTVDRDAVINSAWDDFGAVTGTIANGGITDDSTPTLRGTGPANSTITLRYKLGSGSYASTTVSVDNAGNWSWTPSALAKGSWTFEVQKAGQNGWSSFQLTIDPTLDRNATIDSAYDDFGAVKGVISNGGVTDDATPTLRGTGPANSVITLRYKLGSGGYNTDSVSVDASGNWMWTPNALASGSWTFEVQKAGQNGWSSYKLTIDPTVDRKPTIDSAWDDFGANTGLIANGGITDDATPTLRGTGPANSTILLRYFHLATLFEGTIKVDSSGNWTWTAPALTDGDWTFEVKKSGQSQWSSYELTIDSTADRNATIDSAWDDFGPNTGSLSSGSSTDDTTPTLRGSGPSNGTITLRYKLGTGSYASTTVSVDNTGNWSWTPSGLAKGSWTFEVQKAGQNGWSSFQLTIDPDLDRYPTIDSALDNVGPVTGSLSSGATTDDTTPTLRGSGPANSVITLRYKLGSGSYASTTVSVDGNGKWTWTPSALANGSWTFEVQKAGQSGWSSFTLTIDPTVDRDAVITSAWDDFGAVTGTIANGGTTDDSTPTLRGTGPANSSITLKYSNGGIIIKVDASGNWTWTAPDLEDGHWTFEVKKDGQENWSRYELTIDSNADRNASIDSAFDNAGPVTGSLSSGASTDDTTPTLRGSGPANGTITLRYKMDGGSYASTTVSVDNAGNWSWTPSGLAKGSWTFEVQKSGQNGWSSFKLTIDPALDMQPTIDDAWDNFGAVTGSLKNGDTTDDSTPTLRGKGVAGTIIHIQSSPPGVPWETVGSTVVRADGTWEWTSPVLGGSNTWDFRAQAQTGDHFSAWSNKFVVKYVAAAPDKPTITDAFDDVGPVTGSVKHNGYTDDSTPTLRGKGVAGSIIHFQNGPWDKPWVNVGSTVVKADGTWEWTSPALDHSDNWHFRAYVENSNGQSDWSDSFILNYTDPTPTIVDAFDDFGAQTGSLQNGDTTDDSTPTLRGKGVAGTIIHIQSSPPGVPWEPVGSTVVKADGTWEWTSPALSSSNTWDFQARAQNGDHYSAWSNKFVVKYVAAAPDKPVITDAFDDVGPVTGSVKHNGYTDDSTPTLRGRGVAGSIIHFQNGPWDKPWVNVGSTVVNADGSWEWTSPALDHSDNWHFRACAENSSGKSAWSESFILNYTDPAPTITDAFDDFGAETGSLASGDTTDDSTPTLRGTAPANSVVMIRAQHASGEKTYSVKAGADGKWSWTPDTALAKGDWDFQVKQSGAGNWGESFELNITKDYSGRKGIIDFEDMNLGLRNDAGILFNGNCSLVWHKTYIKQKPEGAPDYFGEHVLSPANVLLNIQGNKIVDIGLDIYNMGTQDEVFNIYGTGIISDKITIKPGETLHLDRDSYGNTFDGNNFGDLHLHFLTDYRNLVIDNIYTIVTPPSTSAQLIDEPENNIHFLDGIDELTEHAITGSETQIDTLQLTGKDQLLDLSQHQAEIQSVEIFDIRGSGDNTLIIDLDALLHYGEKDLFIEDGKTQLMINGDAGDVVQLKDILPEGSDISEWQHQQGTVTVAGVEYEVYSHGDDAELLVQQGVKTELI
nr:Ig-like domain-containing protein [Pantoea sp. GbtcB22]